MRPVRLTELRPDERHLIGVSGGADSVAALHWLYEQGFRRLIVCHLDHGWRGKESQADAEFVRGLAGRLQLACEIATAGPESGKGSPETLGRMARHRFFAACAERWDCRNLILGHHADDQAETVLWNLLRGSHGATGMRTGSEIEMDGERMMVLRPFLDVRKAELLEWLESRGIVWREDTSNSEPIAVRNRLRGEALPLLEEIAGRDACRAFTRLADSGAELREIERWAVDQAAVMDPAGRIHLPRLLALPETLRRSCLYRTLRTAGVPALSSADLDRLAVVVSEGGALDLSGGWRVRRRQGRLLIERQSG